MAAGTRQLNTMEEVLRKQLSMYADMKLAEDADFDWIAEQESKVIERLRAPQDQANANMAQSGASAVPPMSGGMQPGIGEQMPPVMSPAGGVVPTGDPNLEMILAAMAGAGGGAPAGPTPPLPGRGPAISPASPNPDELRRVL